MQCRNQKQHPVLKGLLPAICCEKYEYELLEYYALLLCFENVLQGMAKNNLTKKQTDAEMKATLKHGLA